MALKQKAIFLDRDGTLIVEKQYLSDLKKLRFIKGSKKAISIFKKNNFLCFVISNQSGINRGFLTELTLEKIHSEIKKRLLKEKTFLDGIYYCPHHPNENCLCRKPNTGLIKKICKKFNISFKNSFIIGDKASDIELGEKIGCKTILVLTGYGKKNMGKTKPNYIASNLLEAAQWIIKKK
ncbi:MAG: HAD family hydrolase [bacterium]